MGRPDPPRDEGDLHRDAPEPQERRRRHRRRRRVAQRHGIPLVVDNTIATPFLIRPIEHGADIVVHSGRSSYRFLWTRCEPRGCRSRRWDVRLGGIRSVLSSLTDTAIAGHASFVDAFGPRAFELSLRFGIANDTGPALSPLNGFLLQQGMETLSVRMRQHLASARTVAEWLEEHAAVESVDYAGLPSHPQHALAVRDYGGLSGSVFSFTVRGGPSRSRAVLRRPALVQPHDQHRRHPDRWPCTPATTTHLGFTQETRDRSASAMASSGCRSASKTPKTYRRPRSALRAAP